MISRFFFSPGPLPLLPKLLLPVVGVELALLVLLVGWYYNESVEYIEDEVKERSELLAQAIEQRAQSTNIPESLSRMVETMATSRDVVYIAVIEKSSGSDTPNVIRAHSNPMFNGKKLTSQMDPLLDSDFLRSANDNHPHIHAKDTTSLYIMPTMLPATTEGDSRVVPATVAVKLDSTSDWQELWSNLTIFILAGGFLLCLTALMFYSLLYQHIYRPLKSLSKTLIKYAEGQRGVRAPEMSTREFSEVGLNLNVMLNKQAEDEEQLESYANELEIATLEMEKARDQAERANHMKSDFLATMSHEIRTPMNGIIGMTDLLLSSGLSSKQAHYAKTVQQSADALLGLINDILDFSKIEAGRVELELTTFNLSHMIEGLTELMAIKARDKGVEMLVRLDPGVPSLVRGDEARLRQVLANLLSNAIKFTNQGYVLLSLKANQQVTDNKYNFEITVQDTGIGIPADMVDKIFDKFTQADASTTRKYGGTGLGLAICKQLTELMGGVIHLSSEEGRGSNFRIQLSLPIENIEVASEGNYSQLKGKHLLVVDDLPINLTIMEEQAAGLGMSCTGALNGASALTIAERAAQNEKPFDVVLVDYLMPVQNGEQFGVALRKIPGYENVPMIMMSASDASSYYSRFTQSGFCALLGKPINYDTLAETLMLGINNQSQLPQERQQPSELIQAAIYQGVAVMVVEDNTTNREYVASLLGEVGCEVIQVPHGLAALEYLADKPCQLVLMDCEMPVMDGFTATKQLRETFSSDKLPVLALTGHVDPVVQQRCLDSGMDACLTKPIRRIDLHNALRKWLPQAEMAEQPLTGKTILVVEDNRINREFATDLLQSLGAKVLTADNGLEALRLVPQHPMLDLILMDCQMPEMDGYVATEKLRERQAAGEFPYRPIIAVTANAMKGDREKCLAVGMDDYLTKPVNKTLLLSKINQWLKPHNNPDNSIVHH